MTLCDGTLVEPAHLPQRIALAVHNGAASAASPAAATAAGVAAVASLESVQRSHIHKVLHATGGNKAKAAELLGIARRTLYRWLD